MTGKLVLLYFLHFHSRYKALLLRRSQQSQVHRNYFQHFPNQLLELRGIRQSLRIRIVWYHYFQNSMS